MVMLVYGGKREGMIERSNNPTEKARELQRKLFMAAKLSSDRRSHAMFDRSWRGDVLPEAWRCTLTRRSASIMRRPSVSRVREIRTHGLTGGLRKRTRSGHRA